MADVSPRATATAEPLHVDRVELERAGGDRLLVCVHGRWSGSPPAGSPDLRLTVPDGGGLLQFPAIERPDRCGPTRTGGEHDSLVASFALPQALLPALASGLSLEAPGGAIVALPPVAPAPDQPARPPGQVVDRAVLAERRARRAELGEQASARRASAAEETASALGAQLHDLQRRLEAAAAERAEVGARVQERERDLRAAVQRLHSEQRRREEAAEEAGRRVEAAEASAREARDHLEVSERRADQLVDEVEELRRRAAEAENAVAAALYARRRAEADAATARERLATMTRAQVEALSHHGRLAATVAGSGVLQSELGALRSILAAPAGMAGLAPGAPDQGELRELLSQERRSTPPAGLGTGSQPPGWPAFADQGAGALAEAQAGLSEARRTIARARQRLDELESARQEASREAEAERATRTTLELELAAARAATEAAEEVASGLQRELDQRSALEERARLLIDDLHAQVRALGDDTEERAGSAATARGVAAEWMAAAGHALDETEQRIAAAREAAARAEEELAAELVRRENLEASLVDERSARSALGQELDRELQVREGIERALEQEVTRRCQAEHELQEQAGVRADTNADLEERLREATQAAASLQRRLDELSHRLQAEQSETAALLVHEREATARAREAQARAEREADALGAHLANLRGRLARRDASVAPGARESSDPWLARGLRLLAVEDPSASAPLLLSLLEAQGLVASRPLDYDLDLAGVGPHAVTRDGGRATVRPLAAPRPSGEVDFRLALDPLCLVDLLRHGGSSRLGRRRGMRIEATRRPRRALRSLPAVPFDLADLVAEGVWLEPELVFAALTRLMEPAWTRGHSFAVAQEVEEDATRPWFVRIDDGAPPRVTRVPPAGGPAASVRLSRSGFQRLMAGDASAGEKAAIRGDVRAVGLLAQWVARAQGATVPSA